MIKLGVLYGGKSTESEVSKKSAESVLNNLNKEKYKSFFCFGDFNLIYNFVHRLYTLYLFDTYEKRILILLFGLFFLRLYTGSRYILGIKIFFSSSHQRKTYLFAAERW